MIIMEDKEIFEVGLQLECVLIRAKWGSGETTPHEFSEHGGANCVGWS